MSYICCLVCVIAIGSWVYQEIKEAHQKAESERKRQEAERQSVLTRLLSTYTMCVDQSESKVQDLIKITDENHYSQQMIQWLRGGSGDRRPVPQLAQFHYKPMMADLSEARSSVEAAHEAKRQFDASARADDRQTERSALDRRLKQIDTLLQLLPTRIKEWSDAAERSGAISQQWHSLSSYTLMSESYGQPREEVLQRAQALIEEGGGAARLGELKSLNVSSGLDRWLDVNPAELPILALAFACGSPSDPASVEDCQQLWRELVWDESCDIFLASLYARENVGGVAAVHDAINAALRTSRTSKWYETVSSALMWLGAYDSEEVVLQHMLSLGLPMSDAVKERLHYLSSTSVSVTVLDVDDTDALSFDTTALGWNEDEFSSLFDNLVYQNKTLTYTLAVREEDKSIAIPAGFAYPTRQQMLAMIEQVFEEEYGSEVEVNDRTCVALANGVKEEMDGFVACAVNHPEMALVTITERIGHHLNIKFYTLFCPSGVIEADRAAARSLEMNLNPKAGMWEQALKDTMLAGIQQALNTPTSVESESPDYF